MRRRARRDALSALAGMVIPACTSDDLRHDPAGQPVYTSVVA
jgi:hypothetical protein